MPSHSLSPEGPRRSAFRLGVALVLFLGSLSLLPAGSPQDVRGAAPPPKDLNELKAFFALNCVKCHGTDGSATDPDGTKRPGMDFTRLAIHYRERSGPASQREIRAMARTIRKGIFFGRLMPAWKADLSEEDARLMVKEVLLKSEKGKTIQPDR